MKSLEQAMKADRETALSLGVKRDMRLVKAKQAAAHIVSFMQPYIREDAYEEAYDAVLKAAYESELEVLSRVQIMEMERYRDAILDRAKMEALMRPITIPVIPSDK